MAPTSPRKRGGSVRVRGTCSAGHVTETVSDPGRVTWHGTCADPGCELPVFAKRVPRDVRPPVDPAAQAPAGDDDETVREVSFDVPQPKRTGRGEPQLPEEPGPDEQPGGPADEQQPVPAPEGPGGGAPAPVVLDEQPQRTEQPEQQPGRRRRGADLVGRLRGRRGDEREARVFRHPLDW